MQVLKMIRRILDVPSPHEWTPRPCAPHPPYTPPEGIYVDYTNRTGPVQCFGHGGTNLGRASGRDPSPPVNVPAPHEWTPRLCAPHLPYTPRAPPALETTQGQTDCFFSQLPFKCYLPEAASLGRVDAPIVRAPSPQPWSRVEGKYQINLPQMLPPEGKQ